MASAVRESGASLFSHYTASRRSVHPDTRLAPSHAEEAAGRVRESRRSSVEDARNAQRRGGGEEGESNAAESPGPIIEDPDAVTVAAGGADFDGADGETQHPHQPAEYAAARAGALAHTPPNAGIAKHSAYGVYPLVSSFLMGAGLILIGVACYFSGGDLFAADNKAICLLMMGAALEMMALLLVSPIAAFLLAITIIGFVAMAFLHRQTRAACCPGPANDGQEILDDELQEEAEMFCML
jgi:hypothetical protein